MEKVNNNKVEYKTRQPEDLGNGLFRITTNKGVYVGEAKEDGNFSGQVTMFPFFNSSKHIEDWVNGERLGNGTTIDGDKISMTDFGKETIYDKKKKIVNIINRDNTQETIQYTDNGIIYTKNPNREDKEVIKFNKADKGVKDIGKGRFITIDKDGFQCVGTFSGKDNKFEGIKYSPKDKQFLNIKYDTKEQKFKGTIVSKDGTVYSGQIENNQANGKGIGIVGQVATIGTWEKWRAEGAITAVSSKGLVQSANHKNGELADNKRKVFYTDGGTYEGEYKQDKKHGEGKYVFCDGDSFVGIWKNGKREGKGTYYNAQDKKIESYFFKENFILNDKEVNIDKKTNIVVYIGEIDHQKKAEDTPRFNMFAEKYGSNFQAMFGSKKTTKANKGAKKISSYDKAIEIGKDTDKLEVFIVDHGGNDGYKPLSNVDVEAISNSISNAIVNSKGKIKTLTIKLVNCYGRTYDKNNKDFKYELLTQIYKKAKENKLDVGELPTILISGAEENSLIRIWNSKDKNGKKGLKRIGKLEYFQFTSNMWKEKSNVIDSGNKEKIKELFSKTTKKNYRDLKHQQHLLTEVEKTDQQQQNLKNQSEIDLNDKNSNKSIQK